MDIEPFPVVRLGPIGKDEYFSSLHGMFFFNMNTVKNLFRF